MSRKLLIREAQASDVPAIAAMMGEFFDFLCALDGSTTDYEVADGERKLARSGFGQKPLFAALIAEAEGAAVGYAIFNIIYWPDTLQATVFLSDLFVREKARGLGVGRAIMDRLGEIGREQGCEQLMWTVWRPNAAAGDFYARLGAEELPDEYVMRIGL